ncbi:hypothetical protein [Geodermatophilus sp. SYSU D01105]
MTTYQTLLLRFADVLRRGLRAVRCMNDLAATYEWISEVMNNLAL